MSNSQADSQEDAGQVLESQDPEIKQLSLRVKELERETQGLRRRLDDVQRQSSKDCIVFSGPALSTRFPGELATDMLMRVVRRHWGAELKPNELKAVHFLHGGKRIIAKFLDCKELSNFARILNNRPSIVGGKKIFAGLHLASANDKQLAFIARKMKQSAQIKNFRWGFSGRLQILFSDGKSKTYDREEELRALASPETLALMTPGRSKTAK